VVGWDGVPTLDGYFRHGRYLDHADPLTLEAHIQCQEDAQRCSRRMWEAFALHPERIDPVLQDIRARGPNTEIRTVVASPHDLPDLTRAAAAFAGRFHTLLTDRTLRAGWCYVVRSPEVRP